MRIDRLRLKNFRCFDDFEMEFSPDHNVHVLIAENMAGKSAIFQALRIGLSSFVGNLTNANLGILAGDHRIVGSNPVSDVALECEIEISAIANFHDSLAVFQWVRRKDSPVGNTRRMIHEGPRIDKLARDTYIAVTEREESVLPLIAYIGPEYVHVASSETANSLEDFQALLGYNACLSGKSIETFLMHWYSRMEERLNEIQKSSIAADFFGEVPQNSIEVFALVLRKLLPTIVETTWISSGTGRRVGKKVMAFRFEDNSVRTFYQLSDGYQYLCLLAAELSMRSVLLNKHLGAEVNTIIPGVVLIDEFGIHLHPDLQSATLRRLSEAFPQVQFIVSTHSPMLVNGLDADQVHLLQVAEDGVRSVRHPSRDIIGMGAEGILLEVFGLKSTFDDETLNAAKRYAKLVKMSVSGRLSESEVEEFNQLRASLRQFAFDPSLNDPMYAKFLEMLSTRARNKFRSPTEVTEEEMTAAVDALLAEMGAPNR